ncbi:glycosyltransferase family 4 protein [Roseiarcaceae bacterium H3SJ34-1]|uniref:glycosyltransferase family 4 protein n=1 Tax=Terripilifer ovatus TaxID=3032367 RepID=UPI003AB92C2B|nr:glycosyltransferase family 4 protein [Roseiarcaceae bacterium H3SJ34-1]
MSVVAGNADTSGRLKIVHVFRAPLGGLFRHVLDLTRAQCAAGHQVGIVADANTGGERADAIFRELAPQLALGITRMPMHRNPHPSDALNIMRMQKLFGEKKPHVVHGHGSKGGVYARTPALFAGGLGSARAYTPHGGSFNYRPDSALHSLYMATESLLARSTDIFLFESAYIQSCFIKYVHAPNAYTRVIPNGISPSEFIPVVPDADAADFLYVGELRQAKGIDTLIDAHLQFERRSGRPIRSLLVGTGPDKEKLEARANKLGLGSRISFPGGMPAREAFRRGRTLIVPSRAESLPYIVLEAAAACIPMISTSVGGIPEIYGPYGQRLIVCNNVDVLADAMIVQEAKTAAARAREATELSDYVASRFTISHMVEAVVAGYRDAMARKLTKTARGPEPAAVAS